MTRVIAFASALLLLPVLYWNAVSITGDPSPDFLHVILRDWRGTLLITVVGGLMMFAAGHMIWFVCRAFNFAMRKIA